MERKTCILLTSLLLAAAASPAADALDPRAAQRAETLLSQMTLQEKIGQLVLFTSGSVVTGPTGVRADLEQQIQEGNCGGVFNAHTVLTISNLQRMAVEKTRLHIPLIFGYDVIHGYKTTFPIPLAQASSWDLEAIEHAERVAATEAAAGGLDWTFAPMVDIARDPRWGRIAEGAGEDPFLGCAIARARVRGFQGERLGADPSTVLACVKHYAAYGGATAGRDYNIVDMSDQTLRDTYLPPYKAAVDAGVLSVMTSFNELNGVPATANKYLMTDILRREWGFAGFLVTDYTAINELVNHGVARDLRDAARESMNAGVDMDMQGGAYLSFLKGLSDDGLVKTAQIDEAARRVLAVKYQLGLFDDPFGRCDVTREAQKILTPENLSAARQMACESIVLLTNRPGALPLKTGLRIAVIGPLAMAQQDLLGSWSGRGDAQNVLSILDSIHQRDTNGEVFYAKGCDVTADDRSGFEEAAKTAARADVVVMALGETADMSGEAASRTSIGLPGVQTELLRAIKQTGKPLILVLINGRPLALEQETGLSDAILEAWQPGLEGGKAVADTLFGDSNPSAKLTVSFPRNVGQVPIWYGEKRTGRPFDPADPKSKYKSIYIDSPNSPLYPFGFGLSFTSFTYTNLQVDRSTLTPETPITASIEVANTGDRAGAETVQLYVSARSEWMTRPTLQLRGFQRVALQVGERRRVSFQVREEDLTFLRDGVWSAEPGDFKILIGPSSGDLTSAQCLLAETSTKPGQ